MVKGKNGRSYVSLSATVRRILCLSQNQYWSNQNAGSHNVIISATVCCSSGMKSLCCPSESQTLAAPNQSNCNQSLGVCVCVCVALIDQPASSGKLASIGQFTRIHYTKSLWCFSCASVFRAVVLENLESGLCPVTQHIFSSVFAIFGYVNIPAPCTSGVWALYPSAWHRSVGSVILKRVFKWTLDCSVCIFCAEYALQCVCNNRYVKHMRLKDPRRYALFCEMSVDTTNCSEWSIK